MSNLSEALQEAADLWEVSHLLPMSARLGHLKRLSEYDVFPIAHLAQIARTDPKTVRKHLSVPVLKGGRFHPEALSTLQILEEQVRLEEKVSKQLIELCVMAGCSGTTIGKLIGWNYGKVYRKLEES